jgi:hypothetical protein
MGWGSWNQTETDRWSVKANYEPGAREGSSRKMETMEEEWKQWWGKANTDAEWWNGHYDEE